MRKKRKFIRAMSRNKGNDITAARAKEGIGKVVLIVLVVCFPVLFILSFSHPQLV